MLPIAFETSEEKLTPKRRAAKENEIDTGSAGKNPFTAGHVGTCPNCFKPADMSKLRVDERHRIWCKDEKCKMQSYITHWFCAKCSSQNSKIKFDDCVCYARLLSNQGKIVLRCPKTTCPGWKSFENLPASSKTRIQCHVCSLRQHFREWQCFKCTMIRNDCTCERPKLQEAPAKRKRLTSVLKRPAQKDMTTPTSKRYRRK